MDQMVFRVLIADDDSITARRLMDFLKEKGFDTDHIASGKLLKEKVKSFSPHFIICDLTLVEFNAIQVLRWLQTPEFTGVKPKILVTSGHSNVKNIKECISNGATDYIVKPFQPEEIVSRLIFHIQNKRVIQEVKKDPGIKLEGADLYLNLLELVLKETLSGKSRDDILFNLIKMVAITLRAVRCSLIRSSEDLQSGEVMASSDDKNIRGFKINLNKYPEVVNVVTTRLPVVIEDLASDPQLAKIKELVKGISFNSMIIVPVVKDNQSYGVISARMDREHSRFNERDIHFVKMVGQIVSLFISSGTSWPHEWLRIEREAQNGVEQPQKSA